MKIQCDVCEKEEASVYCTADEASLCGICDRHVHHANKLANKHLRFYLLNPSFKESTRCDICQERRAILFCKEDRAILCRECDISIHKANEHTQKHDRFLLTGVKLSPAALSYDHSLHQTPSSSNSNMSTEIDSNKGSEYQNPIPGDKTSPEYDAGGGSVEGSSVSEYLMETWPGWHVEEFLDPCASHPYEFSK